MIQEQPKILTCEWIRFYDRTYGYRFMANAMIFPHNERLFHLDFTGPLINSSSNGLCMSCSTTGEPDFLQFSFPGKGRGQMNPDFPRALYYTSSDFNDFETDGVELSRSPLSCF